MAKRIPDHPTSQDAVPVASEGILSEQEQAIIAAARASHVDAIRQIKDPATRFRAIIKAIRPFADLLLETASAYPGAAPFVSGIRQALSRLDDLISTQGARADS